MKKVLAISGGVDSMLLLQKFSDDTEAVVAHFDHGTRPSAKDDAEFVRAAAEKYGLPFFLGIGSLGEGASEAEAREARYEFLQKIAKETGGEIYTAHHVNDLVESIVINLLRGTGWRGITPFGNTKIKRVFLEAGFTKNDILKQAAEKKICFRQDPTNTEENYLRNRVRPRINNLGTEKLSEIMVIYQKQLKIKKEIDKIVSGLLPEDGRFERKWFDELDEKTALELLRAALERAGVLATRPQLLDFLMAIKTYAPEKKFNLPNDKLVTLHKTYFMLRK